MPVRTNEKRAIRSTSGGGWRVVCEQPGRRSRAAGRRSPAGTWRIRRGLPRLAVLATPDRGMNERARPSFGSLDICWGRKERSWRNGSIGYSANLFNDCLGEVLATHVSMHLRATLTNLHGKSGDGGLFMNVAGKIHVTFFATISAFSQAQCSISWYRWPSRCVG